MRATHRRALSDRGHSLVEVLVTVGLLVVVSAIVFGVIIQTQKVTRTGSASSFSQSQMVDAVSRVSRDVAISKRIAVADKSTLALESVSSDGCRFTEYLIGDGDNDGSADDLISRSKTEPACVPNRTTLAADLTVKKTMVVKGLKDALLPGTVVFKYFDLTDQPLASPVADTGQVGRVQVDVAADITGRTTPLRLTTSVAPRTGLAPDGTVSSALPPPGSAGDANDSFSCAATQTVTWSRPIGATGYLVMLDGSQFADITNPATTSVTVPVTPGQTRNVAVFTKGVGGMSSADNAVVVRCPAAPVLTGTTVAKDADGFVNDNRLTWPAVSGATNYVIYRGGVSVATVTSATLTWDDPDKVWGSSTAYYVIATNQGGSSANSNTVTRIIAPAAPVLSGSHLDGDRTLTWTAPASASPIVGYEVQRRYTGTVTWTLVYSGPALTFGDTSAIDSDTFEYQVRANNTNANGGGWSAWDNISLMPRPGAPVIAGVAVDVPNNTVTWPLVANATAYAIYRNGTLLANLGKVGTYTDSAIAWASTWDYTVIATNKTGASPSSNSVTLKQKPGPFSITSGGARQWGRYLDEKNVQVYNQLGGVYADWSVSTGAANFDVTFDGALWGNDGTATRFPATGYQTATPGQEYTVIVTANAANGTTRVAAAKDVQVPPAPPKVTWGGTWCNTNYNANGWKFGMVWNNYPSLGYAQRSAIVENKFHTTNAGTKPSTYSYNYPNWSTVYTATTNASKTTMWGDASNTDLIGNAVGDGGGYSVQNFTTNAAFDFGSQDSIEFAMTGTKMGPSPVVCPAANTTWKYNGNTATYQEWTAN